jgi:hypothetical protein
VRETLVRAWANAGSFRPRNNMNAWLCVIFVMNFTPGSAGAGVRLLMKTDVMRRDWPLVRLRKVLCTFWTSAPPRTVPPRSPRGADSGRGVRAFI